VILPTPEQIAEAKAAATERFGRDAAMLVKLTAPVDLAVILAPLGFRAWCQMVDEQVRDVETPKRGIVLRQLLWPAAAAVIEALDRWPAATGKLLAELIKRAGQVAGDPRVTPLSELAAKAMAGGEVIPGLSVEKAKELIASSPEAELWGVVGPGALSVVMTAPDADVFLAARAAERRALVKQDRIDETRLDFIRPLVTWSAQPLDVMLEDKPAVVRDLKSALDDIGGEGAEATSKSL